MNVVIIERFIARYQTSRATATSIIKIVDDSVYDPCGGGSQTVDEIIGQVEEEHGHDLPEDTDTSLLVIWVARQLGLKFR